MFKRSFQVVECPSPALALSNCVIVQSTDFPQGFHVILNSKYPLTTKCVIYKYSLKVLAFHHLTSVLMQT